MPQRWSRLLVRIDAPTVRTRPLFIDGLPVSVAKNKGKLSSSRPYKILFAYEDDVPSAVPVNVGTKKAQVPKKSKKRM